MAECINASCKHWKSRNVNYCYKDCIKYEYTKFELEKKNNNIQVPNLMVEDVTFEDVVDNREFIIKLAYEIENLKERFGEYNCKYK
jgi:hypothetical protein